MDELIQEIKDIFDITVITLDDEVKAGQIVLLVATLTVSLALAGLLRRWFRSLFKRLNIPQDLEGRLLAFLFLIIMIVGTVLGLRYAGIGTGILSKFFHYPLTDLFQPPDPESGEREANRLTLASLFYAFVIVLGMFILSKYVQWVLRRQVLQAFQITQHTQFLLLRFLHFSFILLGILISLSAIGVSFTSMALIFGGLSIGIGFGLQNIASNLVSGFILIFERPIKIGDMVELMDVNIFGRISSINLRSTVIASLDEKEIIVPNSQLITEAVHNLTHASNLFRLRIEVGVSYGSDVAVVKRALLEVAAAHPEVIDAPSATMKSVTAPFVRFVAFGESSLDFHLLAWIPDSFQRFDVASDIHFMIWEKFKEYGITIPFPQRDVHFYPPEKKE